VGRLGTVSRVLLFFLLLFFQEATASVELMHTLKERSSTPTLLLSYPRSGNTWLRFCLEYLTHRPTLTYYKNPENIRPLSLPIGMSIPLGTDLNLDPIWKVHNETRIKKLGANTGQDLLILLVRNYKESLLRNLRSWSSVVANIKSGHCDYFNNLRIYDKWDPDKRILLYYEDLIEDPRAVLEKLLFFLQESQERLDSFFASYDSLRETSLLFYQEHAGKTSSKGEDLHYHSRVITLEAKKRLDLLITTSYPDLWEKYLLRYAEQD